MSAPLHPPLVDWFMRKEVAHLQTKKLLIVLAKVFLASDALALVCWGGQWLLLERWADMAFPLRAVALTLTIALALAAFCTTASLLKLREMNDVLHAVHRKLTRRKKAR